MTNQQIVTAFTKLSANLQNQNKNKIFNFEGTKIYPSEAHMMLLLHETPDSNVTDIAQSLGITKGAVSKTLHKLKAKRLILTDKDKYNNNEMRIVISEHGEQILIFLKRKQLIIDNAIDEIISDFSSTEKKGLLAFLMRMDNVISDLY